MAKTRVGIINVTGYAGAELARLLWRHPDVKLASVTGRSAAGKPLASVFPHLTEIDLDITEELDPVDLAFAALPSKESAEMIPALLAKGVRVIDLSADFRLKEAAAYPAWYGFPHPAPEWLAPAVYGLPELNRAQIKTAKLVANPGCYPTSCVLALAPALRAGLIEKDIILDSKSGVSGAGRTLSLRSHFCEVDDGITAYSLEGHRHLPEIVQELEGAGGVGLAVTFVPHLTPMTRGILTTAYATVRPGRLSGGAVELRNIYQEFYNKEPFVRVVAAPPSTKHVWGSNYAFVYPMRDIRTGRLIVISCIDNLVKGAAGQAVQNMNLMLGLTETAGLEGLPLFP